MSEREYFVVCPMCGTSIQYGKVFDSDVGFRINVECDLCHFGANGFGISIDAAHTDLCEVLDRAYLSEYGS